jgi:hypothetical protein
MGFVVHKVLLGHVFLFFPIIPPLLRIHSYVTWGMDKGPVRGIVSLRINNNSITPHIYRLCNLSLHIFTIRLSGISTVMYAKAEYVALLSQFIGEMAQKPHSDFRLHERNSGMLSTKQEQSQH